MSDQALELVIKARDDSAAAFQSLDKSMNTWTATQQKAAQKMEAMHERALKLNSSFKPLTDSTEKNADALKAFSAALPIPQTEAMTSVVNLASVGFKNLNTSTAGFNAQSAGVVAAALAIGGAIGTWADSFQAVREQVDETRDGLMALVGMKGALEEMGTALEGIGKFQKEMGKNNDEAVARQVAGMKAHGMTLQEIAERYKDVAKQARTATDRVIEGAEAEKKLQAATKEHIALLKSLTAEAKARAEAHANAIKQIQAQFTSAGAQKSMNDLAEAVASMTHISGDGLEKLTARVKDLADQGAKVPPIFRKMMDDFARGNQWDAFKAKAGSAWGFLTIKARDATVAMGEQTEKQQKAYDKMQEAMIQQQRIDEAVAQGKKEAHERELADLESIANVLHQMGGKGFGALGDILSGTVAIADSIDKWNTAGKGFGGTLSKISAAFGIAGAAIGIGKSLAGLFGIGGNKEHMQVNDMRDEFVKAAGGIDVLNQRAHAAGMTLDAMLKAKTVDDYQAAIEKLNGAMDLHGQAVSALQAAQEKYQVGWSKLDQTAGEMLRDQNLLIAAGFSQQEVANGMADAYSKYVQQVIESGGTIPEAMRSTIDLLQQQGKLVDENGDAYDDATVKGLSFTEKLTDQMSKLVDEIHRMVNALLGINDVDINVGVGTHVSGGGGREDYRRGEGMAGGGMVVGWGVPAVLHGTRSNPEHAVREDRLRDIVRQEMRNGDGASMPGTLYVSTGPTYQDGQMVAKATVRRIDLNKARSKGALRGRAR